MVCFHTLLSADLLEKIIFYVILQYNISGNHTHLWGFFLNHFWANLKSTTIYSVSRITVAQKWYYTFLLRLFSAKHFFKRSLWLKVFFSTFLSSKYIIESGADFCFFSIFFSTLYVYFVRTVLLWKARVKSTSSFSPILWQRFWLIQPWSFFWVFVTSWTSFQY